MPKLGHLEILQGPNKSDSGKFQGTNTSRITKLKTISELGLT